MQRLLVLVPDRLSDIVAKGEFQPRYYNPGQVFEEVHILTTSDDHPTVESLQGTVGDARLFLHSYPDNLNLVQARPGWLRGHRLRQWAQGGMEIARTIGPSLIRCHGADWNTFLASRIHKALGTPYVVSLHINPDVNAVRRYLKPDLTRDERRHNDFYHYIEREGLRHAELVMPVYQPILPYLDRLGITRREVCYNVLNGENLRLKESHALHRPPRLVSVGRLFNDKNPQHIITALASIPDATLTIIGDGPARLTLEAQVESLGLARRISFEPAVRNDELCARLPEYDLFVVHTEYFEISKSVLEALLTGLPVLMNRRTGVPVPELQGDFVQFTDDTPEAWRAAISTLLTDDARREALGRRAGRHAKAHWAPAVTEAKVAGIYRRILDAQQP
jgi:glycosyltransferase involved in cell wall biosynthesis